MELIRTTQGCPRKLGILAGAFNPPTHAHLGLARAALGLVDEILFVIPRTLPHKAWSGASLEQRTGLLRLALEPHPRFSAAISEGGLFVEIARESRRHFPGADLHFLCGRDAAERILRWDYGEGASAASMLQEFCLIVAPRDGDFELPLEHKERIATVALQGFKGMSSSEVRERMDRGESWRELVPEETADLVERIYSCNVASRNARSL